MAWNDNLTDEQERAASYLGKHARLLAGPGTGKTRSLTRRMMYLVEEKSVPPSRILALTFTRAATAELKGRLKQEFGEENKMPHVSTLHSFALKTILRNPASVRLPSPIRIVDDYEERWIIQEELKSILGLRKVSEVADLLNQMSSNWEQLKKDWEGRFPNPKFLGAWGEHRGIYGYTLRSELVYQLQQALSEGQLELEYKPAHLLVDEYQDLNACDLAIIKQLSDAGAELFSAGDDDQSIYGFRYADPEGIRRFVDEYKPSEGLELTECKRCDRRILELGLYVARQDPRRLDKAIHPASEAADGEVRILRFSNQDFEALGIAKLCKWLRDSKGIALEKILILLRSDRYGCFSKPIREALQAEGLKAVTVADPLEPLNCPKDEQGKPQVEGRIFLCILRLLGNPRDHLAWRSILELGSDGLGDKAFASIYNLAHSEGVSFAQALLEIKKAPARLPRFGPKIKVKMEAIEEGLKVDAAEDRSDLLAFVKKLAGKYITKDSVRDETHQLFERVLAATAVKTLEELLRAINVSLGDKEQEIERDAVNIMSMHQAKGLTADATIIVAAEGEYVPGRATGLKADDERRLLYVSITRARHLLFLTHSSLRTNSQKHTGSKSGNPSRTLSPFLSGGPIPSEEGFKFINGLR
jgi:DNA helicase-2/ATP-dependent DNA helicase PcrA